MKNSVIPIRHVGRKAVVNREREILRLCQGKKVLHLGCADYPFTEMGPGRLLHTRLSQVASELWGLDNCANAMEQLRAMGFPNLVVADVEDLASAAIPGDFDVIVAGEIIEHLACPGNFLRSIRSIMSERTQLVLTTQNAFGFKLFVHSLLGNEKVHSDHNYYFSYYTISQLLEKFGLRSGRVCYYQQVEGHGAALFVDKVLALSTYVSPLFADGLFVTATVA